MVHVSSGIDLLLKVVPAQNVLFASEIVGAVKGIDPESGFHFDDTKRYNEKAALTPSERVRIYCDNALKVYPRLGERLTLS
jgi:4-oxalmesaconate hydratase